MKKKKIGIITLYGLFNYGNRLQNYAVQKILEEKGYSVETLYINEDSVKTKTRNLVAYISKNILSKVSNRYNFASNRFLSFYKFTKNNIKTININGKNKVLVNKLKLQYDYFVVGSDQVWNPTEASFGVSSIPNNMIDSYKNWLSEMNHISVRENAGKNIVNSLIDKKVDVLIDPTMMMDKEDWIKVSSRGNYKIPKQYILAYFLGDIDKKRKDKLDNIAQKNNLEIINLLDRKSIYYTSGPAEFIDLVNNASLVCTDSFHAVSFSIIFRKPFIVFNRESKGTDMSSRLDSILELFDLKSRYEVNINTESIFKCDFNNSQRVIINEREKFNAFLKMAID